MSLRWLFDVLSPAGRRARLSVVMFHRVLPREDPMFPGQMDAARFDAQLGLLKGWFNVLSLPDAVTALGQGQLPARSLAITFDDGYADNFTVALPILRRHRLSATFFIATGYLDGGRMWNDTVIEALRHCTLSEIDLSDLGLGRHRLGTPGERRASIATILDRIKYLPQRDREAKASALAQACGEPLPEDLMLSTAQVLAMRDAGMSIGAHTVSHPILSRLTDDEARSEIAASKQALERVLGEPVRLFAYPNGKPLADYGAVHVRMARELGFDAAFSTAWGAARSESDLFEIPRFTPWDRTPLRYGLRMAQNMMRRDPVGVQQDERHGHYSHNV
jgi:peptidoglycan/xylan/chitin deacetylase (PgdA/CDA1 family)